jgi:hypothetical protein
MEQKPITFFIRNYKESDGKEVSEEECFRIAAMPMEFNVPQEKYTKWILVARSNSVVQGNHHVFWNEV